MNQARRRESDVYSTPRVGGGSHSAASLSTFWYRITCDLVEKQSGT